MAYKETCNWYEYITKITCILMHTYTCIHKVHVFANIFEFLKN